MLKAHLWPLGKSPEVTCICTRKDRGRRAHRGGIATYAKVKGDLLLLLRSNPDAVTTLIDYYALPSSFPGQSTLPPRLDIFARVEHLESELAKDIADPRFIPNIVIHEFEALLFTSPAEIAHVLLDSKSLPQLSRIAMSKPSPEEINDSPRTHPSRRITDLYPGYVKALYGPQIAERIGIDTIRKKCQHFDAWLKRLEAV